MQRMACQGFSPCGGGGSADFVSIDGAPGVEKLSVVTALARPDGLRLFDNDISLSIDWTLTVLYSLPLPLREPQPTEGQRERVPSWCLPGVVRPTGPR
jgi:hypothetical protein